ncbi:MAG: Ig-like domain-containing protein [Bdellovibrionota bacterium]
MDVTPSANGTVTVDVAGGVAQDAAGNNNTAASQFSITYDGSAPTVSISSALSSPTNNSPIPVTITFSESVTGFVVGDITVGNGSLSNFAGSGTTYTVDVTPSANGTVTVDVAGGVAQDAAGNNNTAATQFSITYDGSAPTVSISSALSSPTNNSPIPVTITFSESVTGFVVGDITVGNGSLSNFAGSGTTYTVDVTPSANGTVTVDVAGGVAQDAAGNNNTAATQFSITYDGSAPTVSISSALSSPTNTSPIPVTITFSESVTGFVVGDITMGNGSLSNFAGSGTTYTVDVTPSANGTVTVDVAGGVAQDAAGNNNTAASQFSITYDGSAPTVSISSVLSSPTNTSPIPVTITFSESVTGFVVGDITMGNGSLSNFAGSGTTYTVDVTPSANGTVTVDVAGGVAQDAAGNNNTAASQFSITYDGSAPTVSISSALSSPTNTSPIPVTITFSESVTGFVVGDITVGNGSLSNFTGSGTTYTVDVTPSSDGSVTVDVAGGVAQDAAGNNNTAATQFSITYDNSALSVSISSALSSPTNNSPLPVTITFSESVTGFVVGDITVGDGSLSNFAGSGTTYTVDVTPSANGTVTVDVAGGVLKMQQATTTRQLPQFSITYDNVAPTVSITSTSTSPTSTSPIPVTITFSESVTGFVVGDITVGNGTKSNFAGSGTTYTVDVTPSANGSVTVDVVGGVAQDAAGNVNSAATQFSIIYDTASPSVSITSVLSSPTNTSPIPVTITFSESVTGFVVGDITVGNGTKSNFAGSGTTYTVDVTPTTNGSVTVDVGAAVAQDTAGNDNAAATQFSIVYDGTSPTVSITSSAISPTKNSPIPVTITFSESVTGFVVGDITVGNGSLSNFAGSGTTYTVDVTPSANGTVTVDVGAGVAQDSAGNGNTAATQFSITFDNTPPSNAAIQAFTWTLSSPSNGSTSSDNTPVVSVSGASSENNATVQVYDDAVCSSVAGSSQTILAGGATVNDIVYATDGSDDGLVSFYVRLTDAAGNLSNCVSVSLSYTLATEYTLGGTLSGLGASKTVTLQNNGANNLVLSANGSFQFSSPIIHGSTYNVTVSSQPSGQSCYVTNGSGTATANVSNVQVDCFDNPQITLTTSGAITSANAATYGVSGTCNQVATAVTLLINSASYSFNAPVLCNGSIWSGTIDLSGSGVPQGTVNFEVQIQDIMSNIGSATASETKDTIISVTIGTYPTVYSGNVSSYGFSGSCSDNLRNVSITSPAVLSGQTAVCTGGAFTFSGLSLASQAEGNFTLAVSHTDAVGNNATDSVTVLKDTIAPSPSLAISATTPSPGDYNPPVIDISVTSDVGGLNSVSLFRDSASCVGTAVATGGSPTAQTISLTSDLIESGSGAYNYYVRATDAAGNTSTCTGTATYNLTAPDLVTDVGFSAHRCDSVEMGWTTPNTNGTTIVNYQVQYKPTSSSSWILYDPTVSSDTHEQVGPDAPNTLSPSTDYDFQVRSVTSHGSVGVWSSTFQTQTPPNLPFFCSNDYRAINVGGATSSKVVSLFDGATIQRYNSSNTLLATYAMDAGDTQGFTSTQFDYIVSDKPFYVAGRLQPTGNTAHDRRSNVVWNTPNWAGKEFIFNGTRYAKHSVSIYAFEGATVTTKKNGTTVNTSTLSASGSTVFTVDNGSYHMTSTGFIVAYIYSSEASGGNLIGNKMVDAMPLIPTSKDIIGFTGRSGGAEMSSATNSTSATSYHSNDYVESYTINAGTPVNINDQATCGIPLLCPTTAYQSSSVRTKSNQPMVGRSNADGNGFNSAPHIPITMMRKKYAINVDSEYVAFASIEPGTINIIDPFNGNTVGTLTFAQTGASSPVANTPYRAYINRTTLLSLINSATTTEGVIFESTIRFGAWYEPSTDSFASNDDETILFGTDD